MQETMINLRNSTQSQPAVERDTASKGKKRGGKKWFLIFVILILLVGGGIVGFSKYKKSRNNFIDPAKYQAVFLSNGQVYFGKVSIAQEGYVSLNEVYYLVNNKPLQDQQNANGGAADQAVRLRRGAPRCRREHWRSGRQLWPAG